MMDQMTRHNAQRRRPQMIMIVVVIGLLLVVGASASALGQTDATPISTDGATPVGTPGALDLDALVAELPTAPDPTACTVSPRRLETFPGTETVDVATPIAAGNDATPVAATPAVSDTDTAIIATLYLHLACLNAGDLPRALALTSDQFIADLLADAGLPAMNQEYYDFLSTPAPPAPESQIALEEIEIVETRTDGSVQARTTTTVVERTTINDVTFILDATSPTGYLINTQTRVDATAATPVVE